MLLKMCNINSVHCHFAAAYDICDFPQALKSNVDIVEHIMLPLHTLGNVFRVDQLRNTFLKNLHQLSFPFLEIVSYALFRECKFAK